MIRVKFIKDYKQYKKNDTDTLSPNEAFGVIDAGYAIVSKDMTESDYQTSDATPDGSLVVTSKKITTREK